MCFTKSILCTFSKDLILFCHVFKNAKNYIFNIYMKQCQLIPIFRAVQISCSWSTIYLRNSTFDSLNLSGLLYYFCTFNWGYEVIYIYMYIYSYLCIFACVGSCWCMCFFVHVYVYMNIYIYIYAVMFSCVWLSVGVYAHVCLHTCVCVCVCVLLAMLVQFCFMNAVMLVCVLVY